MENNTKFDQNINKITNCLDGISGALKQMKIGGDTKNED